jgi:hypothetical protein
VALVLTGFACSGTTEGRSNPELQPGSGELGEGDAPSATDAEPEPDPDAGAASGAVAVGRPCGADDARREIEMLPSRLYLDGWTLEERLEALQLGTDPTVASWYAASRAAATGAAAPAVTATSVRRLTCVDDGSATLQLALGTSGGTRLLAGSAMLVDGSWRITLDAVCRWNPEPPCADEGLVELAANALSPALRARLSSQPGVGPG